MQLNSTEIADLIKKRIEQFKVVTEARDEGTIWPGLKLRA